MKTGYLAPIFARKFLASVLRKDVGVLKAICYDGAHRNMENILDNHLVSFSCDNRVVCDDHIVM